MLELKGIKKDYLAGENTVHALKGIDLKFRQSEFVSILGQSGCGKTTMLNIIGGLDQYTEGDLIINGRSTKDFKDRDWDAYRNHSIGFVFQSYNLIPHQTVLQNVELALTLSGVSKSERKQRAKKALEEVGLGNQLHKKPSEMSGGQMQRVAIARAIVNDPDIILADEPTGALDSATSVQVMDILKKIAENRLVIMVTHNPELAEQYSTRIVRMTDGLVKEDSAPLSEKEIQMETVRDKTVQEAADDKQKKPSMSFATSFGLSLKNLFTKKGRGGGGKGKEKILHVLLHLLWFVPQKPLYQKGKNHSHIVCGKYRHYRDRAYLRSLAGISELYRHNSGGDSLVLSADYPADQHRPFRYHGDFHEYAERRR